MKKKIVALALAVSLLAPTGAYPQFYGMDKDPGCCFWCLLYPVVAVVKLWEGIKGIGGGRTVSVDINGTKAVFKRNTVKPNKNRRGAILKGELVEKVTVRIRGRELTVLPGTVKFYENGKIASCEGFSAGLLTGGDKPFPCNYSVELHEDEYLKGTRFKRDEPGTVIVQGAPRKVSDWIRFHRSGAISECRLAVDGAINIYGQRVLVPEGTAVGLTESQSIAFIDTWVSTVRMRMRGRAMDLSGRIEFFANGDVRSATIGSPVTLQNGPHRVTVDRKISFYDNGMIESCTLASDVTLTINGSRVVFEAGRSIGIKEPASQLHFYRNGRVRSGDINGGTYTHRGVRIPLTTSGVISYYEGGAIKLFPVEGGTVLRAGGQDIRVKGYKLMLYENGGVLMAELQEGSDFLFRGKPVHADSSVYQAFFDERQEVVAFSIMTPREVTYRGNRITLPPYYAAGYADYDKKEISFADICWDDLKLPDNATIVPEPELKYSTTKKFVKADRLINAKRKNCHTNDLALLAEGVREIMFSDDVTMVIDGKRQVCKAMRWVKLR